MDFFVWNHDSNFQKPSAAIEPIFKSNMAKCSPDIILLHIIKAALGINFLNTNFTTYSLHHHKSKAIDIKKSEEFLLVYMLQSSYQCTNFQHIQESLKCK